MHLISQIESTKTGSIPDLYPLCRFTAVWGQTRPTTVLIAHPFPKVLPVSLLAFSQVTFPDSATKSDLSNPLPIPPSPLARVGRSGGVREYYGQKRGGKSGLIPFPRCPSLLCRQKKSFRSGRNCYRLSTWHGVTTLKLKLNKPFLFLATQYFWFLQGGQTRWVMGRSGGWRPHFRRSSSRPRCRAQASFHLVAKVEIFFSKTKLNNNKQYVAQDWEKRKRERGRQCCTPRR